MNIPAPCAMVRHRCTNKGLLAATALLALLVAAGTAWGQATTSVRGTITDSSGGAVASATVTISNAESRLERSVTTGADGSYQFLLLPPGTYKLAVSAQGFQRYEETGLQLLVNTPATVNVQLKVGESKESVTVTAEAPALNMVDASLGNSFGETQVKQLPLDGRNVPELLSLQAGVAYTGNREDLQLPSYKDQDTRSGAVNGARSDQSNITLDGVDVNDQNSGYAFTSVLPTTQDSVQEFRVTTTNYDAEQGVGSGAQVSLVTKSGSNDFHGSLYEYNRFTATSANDYLIKSAEIQDCQLLGTPLSASSCNKPLKLIRNVFGTSLGGPIKKDRLFFFANYEGTRRREEQSAVRTVPSPSLRDGVIQYACAPILDANGNVIQTATQVCPNTTTVTGESLKTYTVQPGFFAMGPTQITNLDPLHLGPNPVNLAYFNQTFANTIGNDNSVGDGLNYVGFRFRAPVSLDDNVFIARVDYHLTQNGKHLLFWRGALHNLFYPQAPFLPGTPPEQTIVDHSKGFVVGYTAVLSPATANTFHWGFTRQSTGFVGNTNQPWNVFYTLDTDSHNYSHDSQVPVHNLLDDFSWTKAGHTFQFGTNIGFVRDPRVSSLHSWYQGEGATFWMAPVAFANTFGQSPLDPINATPTPFPEPASTTAYDYPMLGLLGMVSLVKTNINYDRQGNILPQGTPIKRDWGLYWYEFYAQDSWRLKPNLTVTYGVRWSLFPPPWEVNGFQASPACSNAVAAANVTPTCPPGTFDLGKYFNQNKINMQNGLGFADGPLISYVLGGSANNGPGLYHFEKTDFSPRFSIAYSPRPHNGLFKSLFGEGDKTVIRVGFGTVYDRPGMQILSTFDSVEPAGLSATLENACCTDGAQQAARITFVPGTPPISGMNNIPAVDAVGNQYIRNPLPPGQFPQTPPSGFGIGQAITWGIDQSLKTPYAYAMDFSIGRELPKGFSLQLAYVGRLGRRLLTQRDLAQPLDLVDPKTKIDYFTAATAISKLARSQSNPIAPTLLTPTLFDQALGSTTIAYWSDLLKASGSNTPPPAGTIYVMPLPIGPKGSIVPTPTTDIAQAVYALYVTSGAFAGDEVVGLGNVDLFGLLADNAGNSYYFNGKTGELLNQQLTTDYAWSSVGRSNYNGLQANLRKRLSHGVQFDLNYTYSKSIDFTSGAARLGYSGTGNVGAPGSRLVNAFSPSQVRAVSDFDTTHQINANWIAELPFGKGRYFGRNGSGLVDAFIGGWHLSGLARWTTGFPFTIDNGQFWATNWDEQGSGQLMAIPKTGAFPQPDGSVSVFANPVAANNDFVHPFPGQSGSRNVLRGDGFASWDTSLSKTWKMPYAEGHRLQFRWEVFNVPNLHRFNVQAGLGDTPTWWVTSVPSHFGDYAGLLTQPRVMQFALRYEF